VQESGGARCHANADGHEEILGAAAREPSRR
jgi:hypothetical protein